MRGREREREREGEKKAGENEGEGREVSPGNEKMVALTEKECKT